MRRVQDDAPSLDRNSQEWLERNVAEQEARRVTIETEMDELAPQRDHWIDEFFDRIQRWGFNFNGDQRRKISKEELPAKPDRPFKVNF
jgi:hypothetical protein